jgi:hypothetical protein
MSSPRALAVGALLTLVAGTAACGVSSVAPKVQLRDALGAFGEAGAVTFTTSLPSSVEDVRTFIDATGEDDDSLDDTMLEHLLGIEVLAAYDRRDADDPADDASRVQFQIDGEDYAEARGVDETGYFRVDLDGLSERFPEMADDVDTLREDLEATDLGVFQPVAEAALAGEWLSLDVGEGSFLAEQTEAVEEESGQQAEELQQQLLDLAEQAAKASVTVRKAGTDDLGERLVASVNTRDLYSQVEDDLPGLLEGFAPAAGAGEAVPPADEVPSRDVSASFWVQDDVLRRVELDLAQFLEEPAGHLVVRVDIAPGKPTVEAPDDAVEIDLEALIAESGAAMGGVLGGGDYPEDVPVTAIEDVAYGVGYDFQYYAETEGLTAPTVDLLPLVAEYYAGMEPPLEMVAVGERVQVTYDGEVACLTLPADLVSEGVVVLGPC